MKKKSSAGISGIIKSAVTDTAQASASFQSASGITAKVIRTAHAGCCETCAALAGEYVYGKQPADFFRRHNGCSCTVAYDPGNGRYENAHKTQAWNESREAVEWRKQFSQEIEKKSAGKRIEDAQKEMYRRKIGSKGQEIIDQPTYSKLTKTFLKNSGTVIRGEEAERHLKGTNANASYIAGGNTAFIRDEATVSDVLEEMFHALQDRENHFGSELTQEVLLRREIEAQEYLLENAERYKIPDKETQTTLGNLNEYKRLLSELLGSFSDEG